MVAHPPGPLTHPPGPLTHPQGPQTHPQGPLTHPQGPQTHPTASVTHTQPPPPGQPNNQSPEGEHYGFGMQFHLQSNNYYQFGGQQPVVEQQAPAPAYNNQQVYTNQPPQQQPQQQQYNQPTNPHYGGYQQYSDQVMHEMDPTLAQRPQPPDIQQHPGPALHHTHPPPPGHTAPPPAVDHRNGLTNGGPPRGSSLAQYDQQTAMRVRRWIEQRSAPDVQKCRPILNAEIQQGFCLRKTSTKNDRSAPRFY